MLRKKKFKVVIQTSKKHLKLIETILLKVKMLMTQILVIVQCPVSEHSPSNAENL